MTTPTRQKEPINQAAFSAVNAIWNDADGRGLFNGVARGDLDEIRRQWRLMVIGAIEHVVGEKLKRKAALGKSTRGSNGTRG